MDPLVLTAAVLVAWLAVAAVLALGVGRAAAVARRREEHDPRDVERRPSLLGRVVTTTARRTSIVRSR